MLRFHTLGRLELVRTRLRHRRARARPDQAPGTPCLPGPRPGAGRPPGGAPGAVLAGGRRGRGSPRAPAGALLSPPAHRRRRARRAARTKPWPSPTDASGATSRPSTRRSVRAGPPRRWSSIAASSSPVAWRTTSPPTSSCGPTRCAAACVCGRPSVSGRVGPGVVAGHPVLALDAARRACELAPDDEPGARRLMRLLDGMGDRAGALRVHRELVERLAREFAAEPSAETRALGETLRQAPALPVEAPRRRRRSRWPSSLRASPPSPADTPGTRLASAGLGGRDRLAGGVGIRRGPSAPRPVRAHAPRERPHESARSRPRRRLPQPHSGFAAGWRRHRGAARGPGPEPRRPGHERAAGPVGAYPDGALRRRRAPRLAGSGGRAPRGSHGLRHRRRGRPRSALHDLGPARLRRIGRGPGRRARDRR